MTDTTLTPFAQLLSAVYAGKELRAVSERDMVRLCTEMAARTPRRFIRAHREAGGRWTVAMIGAKL